MSTEKSDSASPSLAGASIDVVEAEGRVLLKAAADAGPGAPIPFCPTWTVGELVPHLGFVYRWAGAVIENQLADPPPRQDFFDTDPDDAAGALERTSAAHENLLRVLRATPTGHDCWTIWKPPASARDFWIRRMLHETLVHRVDAENAAAGVAAGGGELDTALATDGVDEMVCGFAQRYSKSLRAAAPMTIALHLAGSDLSWWVRITPEAPLFGRGLSPFGADVDVRGGAGELYLWLWNRRGTDGLEIVGNPEPLATWTREAHL